MKTEENEFPTLRQHAAFIRLLKSEHGKKTLLALNVLGSLTEIVCLSSSEQAAARELVENIFSGMAIQTHRIFQENRQMLKEIEEDFALQRQKERARRDSEIRLAEKKEVPGGASIELGESSI